MTSEHHDDRLSRHLRQDASRWNAEPPAGLSSRIARRLEAGGPVQTTEAPTRQARPLPRWALLAAPLAAALLIWLAAGLADPPAPRFGAPLAALQTSAAPALHQVIDEPLLEEWRRVSAEAQGTARYLARQVTRPLRGLGLGDFFGG